MRRKDRELPAAEAWRILDEARECRLGVISDGHPYVVPMSHAIIAGKIYFHSALEGEKLTAIAANPAVCVETSSIGEKPGDCFTYRSAIAFGRARLVDDRETKLAALAAIAAKYEPGYPRREGDENSVAIIEVSVDRITGKARN
ncbi:MAG: pyridoxamine 5'-phosphate oxidase family protein [Chloroflexota bacterium]